MSTLVTPEMVRPLAHKIFWAMKAEAAKREEEYYAECEEWAEEGYRPHYCIHGTNLWTDYDPICGPCEDGEPLWDDARDWADAKWRAEETLKAVERRTELASKVRDEDPRNGDLIAEMSRWSFEPFKRLSERFGF